VPDYRLKSEKEMAWNAIRRAATAKFRLEAAAWIEKRLNDTLPGLQVKFYQELNAGHLPELEAEFETWVDDAIKAQIELPTGEADAAQTG
jgi:hypothetical protein